jgi:predicted transcriptional regulator
MRGSDSDRKQLVLDQVHKTPGANLRQVQRYTGVPLSTTARLLDELENEGKVESESDIAYRRFFPVGKRLQKRDRMVLAYVNKTRPRKILAALLEQPGLRHGELADHLLLPAPTLTYYMKQLVAADLVKVRKKGASRMYKVKNIAQVEKALQRTQNGYQSKHA